jgi:hypothetical protein
MMRAMLYEAAQAMLLRSAKWSWLKAWAMQIARRRGMKRAIVALARRLAVIHLRLPGVHAGAFPENPPIAAVESAAKEAAATGAFALDAIRFGKWRD